MNKQADYWIEKLGLHQHPEGGMYTRSYCSDIILSQHHLHDTFSGDRPVSTAIYFLLQKGAFSAFHRLKQDELWHFYTGDPIHIHVLDPDGNYTLLKLGTDPEQGEMPQHFVEHGCWFASESMGDIGYSLCGCTVSPGFDFEDFELANRSKLIKAYPDNKSLIERLTRV